MSSAPPANSAATHRVVQELHAVHNRLVQCRPELIDAFTTETGLDIQAQPPQPLGLFILPVRSPRWSNDGTRGCGGVACGCPAAVGATRGGPSGGVHSCGPALSDAGR